jgi:Ca2+-binding EF-hand superfamily protein
MFSPVGKKKLLLRIQRAGGTLSDLEAQPGGKEVIDTMLRRTSPTKADAGDKNELDLTKPIPKDDRKSAAYSKLQMEKFAGTPGIRGAAFTELMDAASRWNPERDENSAKAFQSTLMSYDLFRLRLKEQFLFELPDKEFKELTDVFDPSQVSAIDGYDFLRCFAKLQAIHKDSYTREVMSKQRKFEKKQKQQAERERLTKEKIFKEGVDFEYTEEIRRKALGKIDAAAVKFDAGHPSAASLEAFETKVLNPFDFKGVLRRTFGLRLSPKEFGALIHSYEPQFSGVIESQPFLRKFLRRGQTLREKVHADQRKKQEILDKEMEDAAALKKAEDDAKMVLDVDYEYTERDEEAMVDKLVKAATKYQRGHPSAMGLEGFDNKSVDALQFKEVVRRTFGLNWKPKELGAAMRRFEDKANPGFIMNHEFLVEFTSLGQKERHKVHIKNLEQQERDNQKREEQHLAKLAELAESNELKIDVQAEDDDIERVQRKMLKYSAAYTKGGTGSVGLEAFDAKFLLPGQFKEVMKRTFGMKLGARDLAAMFTIFDPENNGHIICADFLVTFLKMGADYRYERHSEALEKQRYENKVRAAEDAAKLESLKNKGGYIVDYDYTSEDAEEADDIVLAAATKYNKNAPGNMALTAFETKHMNAGVFKEQLKRTFGMKLTDKHIGYLFDKWTPAPGQKAEGQGIICNDFTTWFCKLGISEREKVARMALDRQRNENEERVEREAKMAKDNEDKGMLKVASKFTEDDLAKAMEKVLDGATAYDKNSAGSPALDAFEVAFMSAALFKEQLKAAFNIRVNGKELAALMSHYGEKDKDGHPSNKGVNPTKFLVNFIRIGFENRSRLRKEYLDGQRQAHKDAKAEAERKLAEQWAAAELKVDFSFEHEDQVEAMALISAAAKKFTKGGPGAPNLDAWSVHTFSPGIFREMLKRTFNLQLKPRQLASVIRQFDTNDDGQVRTKDFMLYFMNLGKELRQMDKTVHAERQRLYEEKEERTKARKKKMAEMKNELDLDGYFRAADRTAAFEKFRVCASRFNKTAPGAPSLAPFDAKFLTPQEFKGVVKRTFGLNLNPKELSALVKEFQSEDGNVPCHAFLVKFLSVGMEEREKFKIEMLEKQRHENKMRKQEDERKLRELEEKSSFVFDYSCSPEESEIAMEKMRAKAAEFDKTAPGALSLACFDCPTMPPGMFREMCKRIFNLTLTNGELAAVMQFFDDESTGRVPCKKFLNHFLKLGIAERRKLVHASLAKVRVDKAAREKAHEDLMAANAAKMDLDIDFGFSDDDLDAAMDKLQDAAMHFKGEGTKSLSCFDGTEMKPAVFREMLKRVFNLKVDGRELGALVKEYDKSGNEQVDCNAFIVSFIKLGFEARAARNTIQLERNREMELAERDKIRNAQELLDSKVLFAVDYNYSTKDFNTGMEYLREAAQKYDKNHPSAPSLEGFKGSNMSAGTFKDQLRRAFGIMLTPKQAGAVTRFFDTNGDGDVDAVEFMMHFNRLVRLEQNKVRAMKLEAKAAIKAKGVAHEKMRETKKARDEQNMLSFIKPDEESCLNKLRLAAQKFAVDSSSYIDSLQGFKGSAMTGRAFRELFRRIFNMKLTYPEVGVVMSIFDEAGIGSLDGPKFLNAFMRLGRLEEKVMLQEWTDPVTLDFLRGSQPLTIGTATKVTNATKERYNSPTKAFNGTQVAAANAARKYRKGGANDSSGNFGGRTGGTAGTSRTEESTHSENFNNTTVHDQSWVLPHVAGSASEEAASAHSANSPDSGKGKSRGKGQGKKKGTGQPDSPATQEVDLFDMSSASVAVVGDLEEVEEGTTYVDDDRPRSEGRGKMRSKASGAGKMTSKQALLAKQMARSMPSKSTTAPTMRRKPADKPPAAPTPTPKPRKVKEMKALPKAKRDEEATFFLPALLAAPPLFSV